ncbi:MAG: FCD domain-containing protein, partial [Rhodospirillales bacterium]
VGMTENAMVPETPEKADAALSFSPVKAILRHQSIIDQIMGLIESGALRVGDKFPPERMLSDRWQVSRPVPREAFRVLQSQGIVESRHGDGRYVRSVRALDVNDLRRRHLIDRRQSLLQIWEVRALLEVQAARLAAANANEEQILAIERPIVLMGEMAAPDSRETDLNMEIHAAVARASGNDYLAQMILRALEEYRALDFKDAVPIEEWKGLQEEHWPIARAIRSRSPEQAGAVMTRHFEDLKRALDKWSGPSN